MKNSDMTINLKNLIWIYPFALYRLDAFEDYLTKMYYTGYQLKKLYLGFILAGYLIGNISLMDVSTLSGKATLGIFIGDEKNRNIVRKKIKLVFQTSI